MGTEVPVNHYDLVIKYLHNVIPEEALEKNHDTTLSQLSLLLFVLNMSYVTV